MTDTAQQGPTMETWMSNIRGRQEVKRFVAGEAVSDLIDGGHTFTISSDERRLNQAGCVRGLDPFTNGIFTPVELAETDRDFAKFADLVVLTDSEIEDFLRGNSNQVAKKIEKIDNEWPLRRLLEVAVERDAAPSKQKVIQDRLDLVAPPVKQEPYVPDYVPQGDVVEVNPGGDEGAGPVPLPSPTD